MCSTRPLPVLKGHHELTPEPPLLQAEHPQLPHEGSPRPMAAPWPCPAPIQQPLSLCMVCPGAAWCWAEAAPSPSCPWSSPGLLQGGLSARVLWGVRQGWGARLSPDVPGAGMRGAGHKPEGRGCPVNVRMCFFTVRVTELIREVVEPPSWEIFPPHLDMALGDLFQVSLLEQGWAQMDPEVPPTSTTLSNL